MFVVADAVEAQIGGDVLLVGRRLVAVTKSLNADRSEKDACVVRGHRISWCVDYNGAGAGQRCFRQGIR